ncbi:MAG: prolyl oligopeptidase family serine peptidase [Actinomycetota bacterium]|nr:prolyl oligopeptidase family serine peptidase [Actinomycetota bacterium]MDQ2958959.1 prolyl oligopeptidase family serine peptidase [Actinomycetota bacterium]
MSEQSQQASPPVVARKPIERVHHGDTFVDNYEWLRDKTNPEVLDYLRAENAYTEAGTAGLESLRQQIFDEISARTRQTDLSVPVRQGGFWYYSRTVEGAQYPVYCRLPATGDQPPNIEDQPQSNDGYQAANDQPTNDRATDEQTANEQTANDWPTNGQSANDWPTNGQSANDRPTNGQSANDRPTNGQSANGQSTNDQPTNEQAANEQTANDQPTNDQATSAQVTSIQLPGEQVILDGNELAIDSEFFALGANDVSPDGTLLAYSVDLTGDERFTLRIRDLRTGKDLPDEVTGTFYSSAWSADGSAIFYLTVDDAWRPNQVWRHTVGTAASTDVVVYTEEDERFWLEVELTRNQQAIQISIASKLTTEVWLIDAHSPESAPVVVAPRTEGIEYQVEHAGDQLLIVHNTHCPDFELSSAPLNDPRPANWRTLVPGTDQRRLIGVDAFAEQAVLYERHDGLTNLSVLHRTGDQFGEAKPIEFDELIYSVRPGTNLEWQASSFRLVFGSMVTPDTVYDYDLATGNLLLRKQQPVLGVDLANYRQSREWAIAPDGTKVPLSVVSRADLTRDGNAPVVLYGYGSYESSIDPYFSIPRLSLLDRGVVYAIAHVRGGGELGRHWYDQGKMLSKKNTFTDFVAAAEHLVLAGWTRPERIVAEGGSAGGLLMGGVANLAPQAFGGIVARVPFVDSLTTILNPALPLTVIEWEEWGNPLADPEVYAYMKSYAPYENIRATEYPAILATTSLNDTRVFFVEAAKWVAHLRATTTGSAPIMLKTEMEAGHRGRSGRYDKWHELAFILAWELDTLGVADAATG